MFALLAVACASAQDQVSSPPLRYAAVTELAKSLPVPTRDAAEPSAPEPSAPEPARCDLAEDGRPPGFYAGDPWPRGQVVLTFDDGPHVGKTPKVLDLLARHDMVATFFLIGSAINRDTYALVQRMVNEGHSLGAHSYNHDVKMAVRNYGERSVEYIRGQHETTRLLIELSLIAESKQDFDALFARVFEVASGTYLKAGWLRTRWRAFAERHAAVLRERGYAEGERPYRLVYSRPPAGTPYVGLSKPENRALYDAALERLGLLNVMWHGESGDTHPEKKRDFGFLLGNLRAHSRRGGVLLIHDYVRTDALTVALARMAADPEVSVVPLHAAVERVFGCDVAALGQALEEKSAGLVGDHGVRATTKSHGEGGSNRDGGADALGLSEGRSTRPGPGTAAEHDG